tara:strand:+ start:527 stop:928 length:402 start_codon:yes stop_codon:yes gene_type:complete
MAITKEYKELKDLLIECDITSFVNKGVTEYEMNNRWIRRYFRMFLDGSYGGQGIYNENCRAITECNGNYRKLRAFIVPRFIEFIKLEFKMSEYQIRKAIFEAFNYSKDNTTSLDAFNNLLIFDAEEMARAYNS